MTETITSRRNPLLLHTKKLLTSRSYRESCREFAAEGTKLLEEAAKWYAGLHTVIAAEDVELCKLPENVRIVRVPEDVLRSVSTMDAPQGVIFLCRRWEAERRVIRPGTLLLDGIQDPGNLGTILRTADALGVSVVLLEGCADAYSHKTVRASMGAVFRTSPAAMEKAEAISFCKEQKLPLLVTAMRQASVDIRSAPLNQSVVVIGSEGQGVSRELFDAADGTVIIPMRPECESLNAAVAAAIVMWQMQQ